MDSTLVAAEGHHKRALILAAASAAHRERIGVSLPDAFASRLAKFERAAASGLDRQQPQIARATGRAMTLAEAVRYALRKPSGIAELSLCADAA